MRKATVISVFTPSLHVQLLSLGSSFFFNFTNKSLTNILKSSPKLQIRTAPSSAAIKTFVPWLSVGLLKRLDKRSVTSGLQASHSSGPEHDRQGNEDCSIRCHIEDVLL
ncbi:hypothetical protein J6590_027120 [Homalodisca vitripennis]|nr:hypothetical protein J6590_027120 [Homalodisca vitripennis]